MKVVGGWDIISQDRNRREGGVKKEGRQVDLHHVQGWWMDFLLPCHNVSVPFLCNLAFLWRYPV